MRERAQRKSHSTHIHDYKGITTHHHRAVSPSWNSGGNKVVLHQCMVSSKGHGKWKNETIRSVRTPNEQKLHATSGKQSVNQLHREAAAAGSKLTRRQQLQFWTTRVNTNTHHGINEGEPPTVLPALPTAVTALSTAEPALASLFTQPGSGSTPSSFSRASAKLQQFLMRKPMRKV